MAAVIVGHPAPGFSGYARVAGRGLYFIQGFTEPVDLSAAQQTTAKASGFTIGGGVPVPPAPDPFQGLYLTEATAATAATGSGPLAVALRAASVSAVQGAGLVGVAPTAAIAPGLYLPHLNAFNWKPSNTRKLRAYLGRARSGVQCKLAFAGDSTVAGLYASAVATKAWPAQLRTLLAAAGYPSAGTGLVSLNTHSAGSNDPRWAYSSTDWIEYNSGFYNFRKSNGAANLIATSTSDVAGTVAQVFYLDSSGPFTVTIDGGAAQPVTPGNTTALAAATYTGLASSTHTVKITTSSVSPVYLAGADVRPATGGVSIWNAGISSSQSSHWADTNFFGPAKLVAAYAPACTFLALGINDAVNAVPVATYKTNMQAVITTLKAAGDVVLVAQHNINTTDLTAYRAAQYELAVANDLPLVDIADRWGPWATANGYGLMTDANHPNDGGYGDTAAAAAALLVA